MSTYFFQFSASSTMFTSVKLQQTIHKGHATQFCGFPRTFSCNLTQAFWGKSEFQFFSYIVRYMSRTSNTLVHFTLSRNACKLRDPPLPITSFATYRVALISCSIKAQVIFEVILPNKNCSSIYQCMALTSRLCCHSVCLNQVSKLNFRSNKILDTNVN